MIIESLLDTDLYKFTMQQVVGGRFADARATYTFRCRTEGIDLRPLAPQLRAQIDSLADLRLSDDEAAFLRGIRFLQPDYIDRLCALRLDPSAVQISTDPEFALTIDGRWFDTILFEVPILSILQELISRQRQPDENASLSEGRRRLAEKCQRLVASPVPLSIMEFGTRRRYSRGWQEEVVDTLQRQIGPALIGTSNVHLARTRGLKPFGTMAHEFLQAGQAFTHVLDSQRKMLETWMDFYRGDLGIALSDTLGADAFFSDFDRLFAKAYDGARHDSGDPFAWGERLIAHYEALGIDPRAKTAVFSDGLDIETAIALAQRFSGRIRTYFGIGTHLTHDLGVKAPQMVIKMVRCNGRPVVKLSDTPGKTLSESPAYLAYVREALSEGSAGR